MLEDFRLKVFLSLAQEQNFTKAAVSLGISQPAVSQNIAELEKQVGRKLFHRTKGEVSLTADGEIFMTYVNELMSTCSTVEDLFSNFVPAVVKIAASEEIFTHFIAPSLETFTRLHPQVKFEKCLFDDPDLTISLLPVDDGAEMDADAIARIRMSVFQPQKMGDHKATHERTSYFDVLFKPSQVFSCTRLCRVLRDFLI